MKRGVRKAVNRPLPPSFSTLLPPFASPREKGAFFPSSSFLFGTQEGGRAGWLLSPFTVYCISLISSSSFFPQLSAEKPGKKSFVSPPLFFGVKLLFPRPPPPLVQHKLQPHSPREGKENSALFCSDCQSSTEGVCHNFLPLFCYGCQKTNSFILSCVHCLEQNRDFLLLERKKSP